MAILLDRLHRDEPSIEARRLLWHVLSAGVVSRDEPEHHESHDKPGAFLFWVVSGRGTLKFEGGVRRLRRGPRCWLLNLQRSRTYVPEDGCKLVTNGLRFAGPGVEAWLEILGHEREFLFKRRSDLVGIRNTQRQVIELINRSSTGYEWQVHLLLTQILGLLLKASGVLARSSPPTPRAVVRVVDAVTAHPERNWHAKDLVRVAGISYSGLRVQFKESHGETLKEFLCRIRLEQARLRLCDPDLTIKDVARQLNFSSEYEFSHFFRRVTGMSPSQYRFVSLSKKK